MEKILVLVLFILSNSHRVMKMLILTNPLLRCDHCGSCNLILVEGAYGRVAVEFYQCERCGAVKKVLLGAGE